MAVFRIEKTRDYTKCPVHTTKSRLCSEADSSLRLPPLPVS